MNIYLITGTHKWPEDLSPHVLFPHLVHQVKRATNVEVMFIHGGAPGVDSLAGQWSENKGIHTLSCKALWPFYGRQDAGPLRNAFLVETAKAFKHEHHVECLAFPIKTSKGTYHCAKLAQAAGIETTITLLDE